MQLGEGKALAPLPELGGGGQLHTALSHDAGEAGLAALHRDPLPQGPALFLALQD